jgi:hypothetical protein
MGGSLFVLRGWLDPALREGFVAKAAVLGILITTGWVVYAGTAFLLGSRELRLVGSALRRPPREGS